MRRVRRGPGEEDAPPREVMCTRLDPEIVAWVRAKGRREGRRPAEILREAVARMMLEEQRLEALHREGQ